ncbi:MAG: carboxylesterase [Candidatus Rokuibacteriota bacterium]|nr:MAG: carboxylesterase [Candidatus Rokubacteria bacterium]PYO03678.1 MAG: carboxylesterase [Candidatus Rokubacteria bacterium]
MTALLETLEIETAPSPRAAVIWMHGLGADGHDFAGIEREVTPPGAAVRYVYPHAPMMPVTINNGYVMRAWYDVFGVAGERREDEAGVRASQERIERLIAREKARGIPARAIVLAGFSQGGAMALHTGLRHPERLAGVMALSCFLPVARAVATEASTANRDVSLFIAHGIADDLIPVARARAARDTLLGLGYEVEWHEYPMAHSLCPQEIEDIAAWLQRTLERKETP